MEPFRFHVYVCNQKKPEGVPSCPGRGAEELISALGSELEKAGLADQVQVTTCGCLGLCGMGPNLVVYPEGVWYTGVAPEDAHELVSEHFGKGSPVARLAAEDPKALQKEIMDHEGRVRAMKAVMEKAGMIPEQVNSIMRGFMESRAVLTAIELDFFTAVGSGAAAAEIAARTGTDPRATGTLLNALAALHLLTKKESRFYNTPVTARFLVKGSPDDSREAMMHLVNLWPRWSTLTECVKKGTSVAMERGESRSEEGTKAFIAAMHKNASFRAEQVVGSLDLSGISRVLDLGGGSGAYAMAFARKKSEIEATVFDLPAVTPLTRGYLEEAGLSGRVKTTDGDMRTDKFGQGFDLVFVSAICHMFSPDENLALFEKILAALNPGGQVVIQDFILDEDKTKPRMAAIFALNMLVNTRGGGTYSTSEYVSWLAKAGFHDARLSPLPGPTDLVIARK